MSKKLTLRELEIWFFGALFIICVFMLLVTATGCSTVLPKMDSSLKYQRDLRMDVEYFDIQGKKIFSKEDFIGVGVIKWAAKYRITLYAPGKADMMVLYSCHREIKTPNPKGSGGWNSEKKYKFEFEADETIEKGKLCMLNAGVYEKKKGRHGWAMLAIQHPTASITAFTRCNGEKRTQIGTGFCQAKEGLIQKIQFKEKVYMTNYGDCRIKKPVDEKNWEFLMPRGKCIFSFVDINLNEFILYSYGYDTIPIRGVE